VSTTVQQVAMRARQQICRPPEPNRPPLQPTIISRTVHPALVRARASAASRRSVPVVANAKVWLSPALKRVRAAAASRADGVERHSGGGTGLSQGAQPPPSVNSLGQDRRPDGSADGQAIISQLTDSQAGDGAVAAFALRARVQEFGFTPITPPITRQRQQGAGEADAEDENPRMLALQIRWMNCAINYGLASSASSPQTLPPLGEAQPVCVGEENALSTDTPAFKRQYDWLESHGAGLGHPKT